MHPDHVFFTFDFGKLAARAACKPDAVLVNTGPEIDRHFQRIYSLNDHTRSFVCERTSSIKPNRYCTLHIRRGDKIKESGYISVMKYISAYKHLYPQLDMPVYIMTDSILALKSCLSELPRDIVFGHSLPTCSQEGYDQETFNSLPPTDRYNKTLEIIVDLEIARRSEVFMGTHTSNIFGLLNHLHPMASRSLIDVDDLNLRIVNA
jgi:hypothetical protein